MQWKRPGSPLSKKFRTQPSASKVMATVFWDSKGIILIDYKPAGTSVTGEYYTNVIKQLRVAIKEAYASILACELVLRSYSFIFNYLTETHTLSCDTQTGFCSLLSALDGKQNVPRRSTFAPYNLHHKRYLLYVETRGAHYLLKIDLF